MFWSFYVQIQCRRGSGKCSVRKRTVISIKHSCTCFDNSVRSIKLERVVAITTVCMRNYENHASKEMVLMETKSFFIFLHLASSVTTIKKSSKDTFVPENETRRKVFKNCIRKAQFVSGCLLFVEATSCNQR